uniref:Uncharacterized protein n=1 Tax=Serratia proteamaculans (strain 568) TaxID=399741 RepID=A8GLP5_SERP5
MSTNTFNSAVVITVARHAIKELRENTCRKLAIRRQSLIGSLTEEEYAALNRCFGAEYTSSEIVAALTELVIKLESVMVASSQFDGNASVTLHLRKQDDKRDEWYVKYNGGESIFFDRAEAMIKYQDCIIMQLALAGE